MAPRKSQGWSRFAGFSARTVMPLLIFQTSMTTHGQLWATSTGIMATSSF